MYDLQSEGNIIFKFKSTPNWLNSNSTYNELLVVKKYNHESDDLTYYAIVREDFINPDNEDFKFKEFAEDESLSNCKIIKKLTKEQGAQIIRIIEDNKDLITVNTDIHIDVCDGSHEEFYFECDSFNRFTEGDCVFSIDKDYENTHYLSEKIDKNRKDAIIVSKAVKDILFYLESLGVYLYEEDEIFLEDRKEELLEYLVKASENTSMYYHAYCDEKDEYWPSFKLFAKSGILFMTSNNRMFDIIKLTLQGWKPHRDIRLLEKICDGENFIMCEAHNNNDEDVYTISLKKSLKLIKTSKIIY